MAATEKLNTIHGIQTLRHLAALGAKFCRVQRRGKRPIEAGWQNSPLSLEEILQHVRAGENAGVLTGTPSGFGMLDIDSNFQVFCERFPGFAHFPTIFREDAPDRGKLLIAIDGELPPNGRWADTSNRVEWLGTGRQGVIAGVHPKGAEYRFLNHHHPVPHIKPGQLIDIIGFWVDQGKPVERTLKAEPAETHRSSTPNGSSTPYGKAALESELYKMRHAREGGRNNQLNESAFALGQLVAGGELIANETLDALKAAARQAGLTPGEIEGTLKSGFAAGQKQPRRAPTVLTASAVGTVPNILQESLPASQVEDALKRGEAGDADLFVAFFADRLVYDHARKTWYIYTGHHWQEDKTNTVYNLVPREVAAQYYIASAKAASGDDSQRSKALGRRAIALCNRRRIENVLTLAAAKPEMALVGDEWDADPWLLGVINGVIDLRTGECRPGRPADFIRSFAPVYWEGLEARAPTFNAAIQQIFADDAGMAAFLDRLIGYGLTGLTQEHVLPILWGEGRNGKSTLLEVLGDVLGPLAISSQADALMSASRGGEGPQPFTYALRGKRLVWVSESNENRRLNTGLVKQLTGGDRLHVRTLHSRPVEFRPSHLLFLLTNHKPQIPAYDEAIWDRVLLIPFTQRFVDHPSRPNEQLRDPRLREKLLAEAPGILVRWVRGCLDWQAIGLSPPAVVQAATRDFRSEEDTLNKYISEIYQLDSESFIRAKTLYDAYIRWARDAGVDPLSSTNFGRRLRKMGYEKIRRSEGYFYKGLKRLNKPVHDENLREPYLKK